MAARLRGVRSAVLGCHAVEMADESVAGGGGTTGVARASLKTEEAMDNTAEEQRSPVLCTH